MRVACALFESRRAEEIALNRARSGAPISCDATERQSAPPELTVAGDRKFESAFLQQRTGSEAKRRAVQVLGAQGAIDYRSEDVVARVVEITGGRGAAADVAGYSRLMGADEEGTLERLKALRRALDSM